MKCLWIGLLFLCTGCFYQKQQVTFLTPLVKQTDKDGKAKVYIVKPKGEYATIDADQSSEAYANLVSKKSRPALRFHLANRIAANPGSYHPGALLGLGIMRLQYKDYDQGAFFVRAALLRTYVDIKLSQDTSLEDMAQVMMNEVYAHVPNLDEEKFQKAWDQVQDEVIAWDKEVPRNYDRRWASLRSRGLFNQKPLNYLPLTEEAAIIANGYKLLLGDE